MIFYLFVFNLILNICNAQEHLTCIRTNDPTCIKQGPPGERGPIGLKGDTGSKGDTGLKGDTGSKGDTGLKGDTGSKGDAGSKGNKGDRGVPDQTSINTLRGEVSI